MFEIELDEKFQEKLDSLKSEKVMKLIESETNEFIKKIEKKVDSMKKLEDFQKRYIKCEIATHVLGNIYLNSSKSSNLSDVESSLGLLKLRILDWADRSIENIKNYLESKKMH